MGYKESGVPRKRDQENPTKKVSKTTKVVSSESCRRTKTGVSPFLIFTFFFISRFFPYNEVCERPLGETLDMSFSSTENLKEERRE